jgi:DNA-binding SARP family transcriptional activator
MSSDTQKVDKVYWQGFVFCGKIDSMLKVYLFGAPRIVENGQPVVIQRRQARTLFFYLAAQEKPQSRLALASLFWPDTSEQKARANLNDLLGKIRRDVPAGILQTTNEFAWLDWQKVEIDYLEYNRLLMEFGGAGNRLPDSDRMTVNQYNRMKSIINLWGGDEFFGGYNMPNNENLEHWRTQVVSQVFHQLFAILERLADYDQRNGQMENAIHWLSLAIRLDEYNEEWRARIIEIYLKAGKLSLAKKYYEAALDFWEVDMGSDPPERLLSLAEKIYNPQPESHPETSHEWPIKASVQLPFIGHQDALQTLLRLWHTGEAALVLGESGSGKTRLVQEVFERIKPAPRLLLGICQKLEVNQPFAPWASILRNFVPQDVWQELDGIWIQTLTPLLPELATLRQGSAPAFSETREFSRAALVEAIHQTLNLLARQNPIFIFIDDVQWADEASLAVVSHLLNHQFFTQNERVLIMATRIEERNPLLDTLLATNSSRKILQVELNSLEMEEIDEIASYMLGQTVSPSFIERLDQDTGGNPLFLLEILQSLLEDGLPENLANIDSLPLPHSVHHLLQRRLSILPKETREVVNTAAFLGSHFTLETIEESTHFIPNVVLDAVDTLEKVRLLQSIPADVPTYAFPHEKIRESILVNITPARKRFFHQNIARALEKKIGEQQLSPQSATLAYHYEQAGDLPNAFKFWLQAGRYAHRLASLHEGVTAFERAERLIARIPELSEQTLYQLYVMWNEVLFQNDDPVSIKRINTALLVLGEERQSPLLIGAALSGMSDAYMAENNFEEALKSAQKGLEYVSQSGNEYEIARTLDRIGVYLYMLNQLPESQPFFQQSLEISRDSIDSFMVFQRCGTYYQLALTAALGGDPHQGLAYAQKSLEDAIRSYHPYGQVLAYSVMGLSHYLIGTLNEGRQACQKGMAFEHIQAWRMLGYISSYYAMNAVELGRLDEAWRYGQKAIDIGRQQGHGEVAGLGYKAIGDMYFRLGACSQAIKAYQQGMAVAGNHFVALENMHRYGYLLYRQGETALGKEYLQRALDTSAQLGLWSIHFLASIHDFEVLSEEGNFEKLEKRAQWLQQETTGLFGQDVAAFTILRLRLLRAFDAHDFETVVELSSQVLPFFPSKTMWRELEILRIIRIAKMSLGQDVSAESERILKLIQHVEAHIGEAPVTDAWQNCKEQVLQN